MASVLTVLRLACVASGIGLYILLVSSFSSFAFFFFQAEDGIRDTSVTGVQTCALPILLLGFGAVQDFFSGWVPEPVLDTMSTLSFLTQFEIGRASCRERV